jgi:hypothetical protein
MKNLHRTMKLSYIIRHHHQAAADMIDTKEN